MIFLVTDKANYGFREDGKDTYTAVVKCDALSDLTGAGLTFADAGMNENSVLKAGSIAIDATFKTAMLNSTNVWVDADGTTYDPEGE